MAGAAGAVHSRALSERRSRERSDFRAALAHRTQVHPLSMCIWLQSIKAKALLITALLQASTGDANVCLASGISCRLL